MADDVKEQLRLSKQLVMTPQLQLAIRLLSAASKKLDTIAAGVKGVVASDGGDDPLLVPLEIDDQPPWSFGEVPAHVTGDVWVDGNPPAAYANRRALPQLRLAPGCSADDEREARWFLRALAQRARTYERIVGELARVRPSLAIAIAAPDVEPVPVRQLAEAIGLHESTIERAAAGCRIENRHRVFALKAVARAIRLAD
jgi:RNA polymerase sigma-54 factor